MIKTILSLSLLAILSIHCYETDGMFYVFQVISWFTKNIQLEWPGTVCTANHCEKQYLGTYNGKAWTIHGLWPSATNSNKEGCRQLDFCTHLRFKESLLSENTDEELNESWVGLFNPSWAFRR